jgi:prepilin-type N-terminal cleavage/methylation domain-containing protein/prepilin-type processing-associated H-X9-DG protein
MRSKRISRVSHPPHCGRKAFTLVELLVVISIIALLMAILLPTLARVRRHAQALGCRANLRQWGIRGAAYATDNEGRLASTNLHTYYEDHAGWIWDDPWFHAWSSPNWGNPNQYVKLGIEKLICCPVATRTIPHTEIGMPMGGSFVAWGEGESYGSYGGNWLVGVPARDDGLDKECYWRSINDRNAGEAPLMFDCCWCVSGINERSLPPKCDAVPFRTFIEERRFGADCTCFNRHDGGNNCLFLDWSVRKVGLKELWTLRWNRKFDTRGPWTKAGGVQAEDWPAWMRKFKDY